MGLVYKSAVSYAQQQSKIQSEEIDAAFKEIKQSIKDETNNRSTADLNLQQELSAIRGVVTEEISARTESETLIKSDILTEKNQRENDVANLQAAINNEKTARENTESSLRDEFEAALDAEKVERSQEISDMQTAISVAMGNAQRLQEIENENLRRQMEADAASQGTTLSQLNERLTTEEQTRAAEDTKLTNAIAAETSNRQTAVTNLQSTLTTSINNEKTARETADTTLQTNLTNATNTLEGKITSEKTAREAADTTLQNNFNSAIATETQSRTNALNSLETSLKSYVDSEIAGVEENLNDFTAPTATAAGKRGLVPAPAKGVELKILTNMGWRAPDDATLTISAVPSQVGSLTYNGNAQTPTWINFDNKKLSISGDTSKIDAGEYTVTFTPLDLYLWADTLDQQPKTATWKIEPLKLAKPAAAVTEFTFNNSAQSLNVSNFDSNYISQNGNVSATNAASYSAVFSLKNTVNTTWTDNSTSNVTISWKINPLKLTKPTAAVTTFTFNNSAQTLQVADFNSTYESQTGTVSATNVNSYSAVYKLKNTTNTKWADNSTSNVTISWTINPLLLEKPSAAVTEFQHDGNTKTLNISNFNSTYENQTGTISAANVGNYSVTFSLKNTTNTKWNDNSTSNVTINWEIKQSVLTEEQSSGFAQIGTLTYNGNSQTVSIQNFDENYHELSSTTSAVNAGTYTVKISPKSGCTWSDGTNSAKSISWTIKPMTLQKPVAASTTFDYDGTTKTLSVSNYNSSRMTQSGVTSASEAGSYQVTYTLNSTTNYIWADNSTSAVVIEWTIGAMSIPKPTAATTSFTYSGAAKTLSIQNYDENYMSMTGTISETDAGEYSVTFKLIDTSRAVWADSSTADVTISWTINRKKLTAAQSTFSQSGTLTYNKEVQTVTISGYNSKFHSLSGATEQWAAGTHKAYVSPLDNYCWNDGTTAAKTVTWTIEILKIPKPYATVTTFTYNKNGNTLDVQNYNSDYMRNIGAAWTRTNVGQYTSEFIISDGKINPTDNIHWEDDTIDHVIINWEIVANVLSAEQSTFSVDGVLTWNGSRQNVSINGYDSTVHSLGGTHYSTAAGEFEATIAPRTGNVFSDGSSDAKVITWKILPLILDIPTAAETDFTFDNTTKTLSITNYNSNYMTRSGTYSASAAGNYQVTFTLKDSANSQWANGSTEPVVIDWSIGLTKVTIPSLSTSTFTYDGNSKEPVFNDFDSSLMTASSETSAVNAGNYVIKVALKDKTRYCWTDNSTDDKTFAWIVKRKNLTAAQSTFSQSGTLNYTGSSQTVTISNYDANYHSLGGVYLSVNAGTFIAKISPLSNYAWNDSTFAEKSVTWTINPIKLAKPTASVTDFTYDKQAHALTISNFNSTYITESGTTSATAAGSYSVKYTLKNTTNTIWADNSTADVTINWKINVLKLEKPSAAVTEFQHDGNTKTLNISNFNSTYMNQTGTVSATDSGEYSVSYSLKSTTNTVWADNSTAAVVINWSIGGSYIEVPTISPTTQISQGLTKTHSVTVNNFDAETMTQSGTVSTSTGKAATYTVTFALKDKTNTAWADGGTANKSLTWSVTKKTLSATESTFTQDKTVSYDGNSHSVTEAVSSIKAAYIGEYYTLSSDTGTNGTITTTITPTAAAQWSDGTSTAKTVQWQIENAAPTLTLASETVTVNFASNITDSREYVTYTTNSSGAISVSSSDNFVVDAVAESRDNRIRLMIKANGTATITVSQAAAGGYSAVTKYITVKVTTAVIFLSWSEIQSLSSSGNLLNYMRIGDIVSWTITGTISGTVGILSINNKCVDFRLIGYNHNASVEGANRAHFMSTEVFTDSDYGKTISDGAATNSFVYSTATSSGDNKNYSLSSLRTRGTEFYNALPSSLQNVIVACMKKRATGSYGNDKIWIPSMCEIFGTGDSVYIQQYEYFANGNSASMNKIYWLRDFSGDTLSNQTYYVDADGRSNSRSNFLSNDAQGISYGFVPCFTVGG